MPFTFAPAGFRIAHFDDDGPMAGRSLADVVLSFVFPLGPTRNNDTSRRLLLKPIIVGMSTHKAT